MIKRALFALLLTSPALAQVTGFSDRPTWRAAAGPTVYVDFESVADGTVMADQLSALGIVSITGASPNEAPPGATTVSVTSSLSLPFSVFLPGTLPTETNFISTKLDPPVFSTGSLLFTFDSPRYSVAGWFCDQFVGFADSQIDLYDQNNVLIGSYSVFSQELPLGFVGVTSTTPFWSARFMSSDPLNSWALDDLEFGSEIDATVYCSPAVPNSTTVPGEIGAYGSMTVLDVDFHLFASSLPNGKAGYFLASATQGFVAQPAGSEGNLCLGGNLIRFASQVGTVANGVYGITVDLAGVPIGAGDTYNFQFWHRDNNPNPTSNFTDAITVTFN